MAERIMNLILDPFPTINSNLQRKCKTWVLTMSKNEEANIHVFLKGITSLIKMLRKLFINLIYDVRDIINTVN